MALLFCDGFDAYTARTDLTAKGWQGGSGGSTINGSIGVNATAGAYGGGACVIGPVTNGPGMYKPNVFPYSQGYTLMSAMAIKLVGALSGIQSGQLLNQGGLLLLGYDTNAGGQSDASTILTINTLGKICFTPYGSPTPNPTVGKTNMLDGVYHWVEIQLVMSTTATGSITVMVDGVIDLQLTGIITIFGTVPTGHAGFGGCGSGNNFLQITTYVDDYFLWDNTGSNFNTFPIGQKRIYTANPSAAGSSAQFTPSAGANYAVAAQAYSGAATLTATVGGLVDLYQTTGLGGATPTQIDAVVVNTYASNPGNGTRKVAGVLQSKGTNVVGPTSQITATPGSYQSPFFVDSTGAAWTAATIAGIQVGMEAI